MKSIKLNVTKELRISWQARLHLHTCRSLSMYVKISKNLLFLCNPLSRKSTCYAQRICIGSALKIREKWFFHETDEAVTKERNNPNHRSRRKIPVYIPDTFFISYIHQYLLRVNFWRPLPKFLIPPFCTFGAFCSYNDSNQHIPMWVLQKSLPSFAYLTWRFKCRVYNTHLFRLKLIMELVLDHLCSKWMTFRGSTLMRQYLLFLEAVLN